jgi:hypothetical protein
MCRRLVVGQFQSVYVCVADENIHRIFVPWLLAVLSVGVVSLLCSVLPARFRWLWVVIVPFSFAYSLYWSPVWLRSDPSEYSAWAGVFVGPWFISGAIPSALLVIFLQKRRAK